MDHTDRASRFPPFLQGVRAALPIGLAYGTVGLTVGFSAHRVGLVPLQGLLLSVLGNSAAGAYSILEQISIHAALPEVLLTTLILHLRYILMGCTLGQRLDARFSVVHKLWLGYGLTDEVFALAIARPSPPDPWFLYGCMAGMIPLWGLGTVLGTAAGD